eukprot:1184702-Alexandrium_andersonii.AAC.1
MRRKEEEEKGDVQTQGEGQTGLRKGGQEDSPKQKTGKQEAQDDKLEPTAEGRATGDQERETGKHEKAEDEE